MEQAKKSYNRLINTIRQVNEIEVSGKKTQVNKELILAVSTTRSNIINTLEDDFDTPKAVAEILSLFREVNKLILQEAKPVTREFKDVFFDFIDDIEAIFGIFPDLESKISTISGAYTKEAEETIKELVSLLQETREQLRKRKIFDLSDEIRNKLRKLGIDIEDKKINYK
jgi:cysteinyl-tRNA synthetase